MKGNTKLTLLFSAVIGVLTFNCNQQPEKNEAIETTNIASKAVDQQQLETADKTMLAGDWIRTDAPYRIQISDLFDDGRMKANYFNPKSINVGKAGWTNYGGILKIHIELRDVNYPGSNYNLSFSPEKDLLAGKYFQAVEGVTYDVEFARKK